MVLRIVAFNCKFLRLLFQGVKKFFVNLRFLFYDRVLHELLPTQSLLGILLQKTLHELQIERRNLDPKVLKIYSTLCEPIEKLLLFLAALYSRTVGPRLVADHHFKEDRSKRPQVGFFAVVLVICDFWSHVDRGAAMRHVHLVRLCVWLKIFSQTKICEFDVSVFVE